MSGTVTRLPIPGTRRLIDLTVDEFRALLAEQPPRERDDPAEYVKTKTMAAVLGRCPDTLCRWTKMEGCPAIRAGARDFIWPVEETIDWMRRSFG